MRVVDFHAHLDERWLAQPLPGEDEFLEGLDRCGVEKACIFTVMGFYGDCRRHNDLLAERAGRHPGRLIPFATVDPKGGPEALEELDRCLSHPVFRGVKLHPWLQAFAPSMVRETLVEILRRAAQWNVPVLFHDGTPPYSTTFQVAAAARWVPECSVVLGHSGLSDYVYAAGQLLRDIPNLYACFCGPKSGELGYLVDSAGPDKVLFGSDFGVSDWTLLAERLDDVMDASLDEETLGKLLSGNAARLLRLDHAPQQ